MHGGLIIASGLSLVDEILYPPQGGSNKRLCPSVHSWVSWQTVLSVGLKLLVMKEVILGEAGVVALID